MNHLSKGYIFEGKYRIQGELGRGGFGTVYLAHQMSMERNVALKVLNTNIAAQGARTARERFLREIKIITKLRHPNTITIHDFGETLEGMLYMVLEFVEGETLKSVLINEGPLGEVRALKIALQIAKSLSEAHRHGIIHRDLKPANIMLTALGTETDVVKVLDFGVARLRGGHVEDLTSVGLPPGERELIGTPRYMSPEQVKGEEMTGQSDVYSLGLILYEMLAGEPAVQGETTIALITQQVSNEPLRLAYLAGCSSVLEDLVRRATAKHAHHRFATIDDMIQSMDTALVALQHAHLVQTSGEFAGVRASLSGVPASMMSSPISHLGYENTPSGAGRITARSSQEIPTHPFQRAMDQSEPLVMQSFGGFAEGQDPLRASMGGQPQRAPDLFASHAGPPANPMYASQPGGQDLFASHAGPPANPMYASQPGGHDPFASYNGPPAGHAMPNPMYASQPGGHDPLRASMGGLPSHLAMADDAPTPPPRNTGAMAAISPNQGWGGPGAPGGAPITGGFAAVPPSPALPAAAPVPPLEPNNPYANTPAVAPLPGDRALSMNGPPESNPYAFGDESMSNAQARLAGQRLAENITAEPEGSFAVAFSLTLFVLCFAGACFYLSFVILGAAMAQLITGPLRLGGAIIASIIIPGVALLSEGGKRERFKIKYDNMRRLRNALMYGIGTSIVTIIITAGLFPGVVVKELRAHPNWFLGKPSSAYGRAETPVERTNREISNKVADTVESSVVQAGLYKPPRGGAAPTTTTTPPPRTTTTPGTTTPRVRMRYKPRSTRNAGTTSTGGSSAPRSRSALGAMRAKRAAERAKKKDPRTTTTPRKRTTRPAPVKQEERTKVPPTRPKTGNYDSWE